MSDQATLTGAPDQSEARVQFEHQVPIGSTDKPISDAELDELCDALLRDWARGSKS